jgi:hypothetical protein
MKRLVWLAGVVACTTLLASPAFGQYYSNAEVSLGNYTNYLDYTNGTNPNWDSATATTGGAFWIQDYPGNPGDVLIPKGTGVMLDLWADSPTVGWTDTGAASNVAPPIAGVLYTGLGCQVPDTGGVNRSSYQFELYVWTGSETTWSQAVDDGEYVADSGVFVNPTSNGSDVPPFPGPDLLDMPAMVLKQILPGDANEDGRVDINDLTIVLTNYGGTGYRWSQGAMDGDPTGAVDINDLTIVLSNYGQSVGASGGGIQPVPEPGSLLLLAAGLGALSLCVWRRRRELSRTRRNPSLPGGVASHGGWLFRRPWNAITPFRFTGCVRIDRRGNSVDRRGRTAPGSVFRRRCAINCCPILGSPRHN